MLTLSTASDMGSVAFATTGGSQSVISSSVSRMTRVEDVFFVEESGSTLLVEDTSIVENVGQSTAWSGVFARTGSIARVSRTNISRNSNVEFGIVSFDSSVTVFNTLIEDNTGVVSTGCHSFLTLCSDLKVPRVLPFSPLPTPE